ncbi:hypothetical protein, partial [Pseudomonas syringae group genomosp. 7]|uniref:hypothetical protein n=1 Tax=Pseudomonas syringae group genomosp. 7 TaxID=251699 RepID=UPI00376F6C35
RWWGWLLGVCFLWCFGVWGVLGVWCGLFLCVAVLVCGVVFLWLGVGWLGFWWWCGWVVWVGGLLLGVWWWGGVVCWLLCLVCLCGCFGVVCFLFCGCWFGFVVFGFVGGVGCCCCCGGGGGWGCWVGLWFWGVVG